MRLEPINTRRAKHKPVRSFKEFCREFGKTQAQLRGMLSGDPDAPKPTLRFHGDTYYDTAAFRRWMGRKAVEA